jgi:hypothetical protein
MLACTAAASAVYKCVGDGGKIVFSDQACGDGFRQEEKAWAGGKQREPTQAAPAQAESMRQGAPENAKRPLQSSPSKSLPRTPQQNLLGAHKTPLTPALAAKDREWSELMEAGKAAYAKRDIPTGASYYLQALRLAQSFGDKENWREAQVFSRLSDRLALSSPGELKRYVEMLRDGKRSGADKSREVLAERKKSEAPYLAALEPYLREALGLMQQYHPPEHSAVLAAL